MIFVNLDKPSPPQNFEVTDVNKDSVILKWRAPANDGGSAVTNYVIEKRDVKRSNFLKVTQVTADVTEVKVEKLTEGNEYFFRVCAENEIGASDWTTTDDAIKAKLPFGKPISLEAENLQNLVHYYFIIFRCIFQMYQARLKT